MPSSPRTTAARMPASTCRRWWTRARSSSRSPSARTAAEDIKDPATKKVMIKSGTLLEEKEVEAIEKAQIQEVRIRSVLTCETTNGVCAKCYGRDLARGTPV